MAKKTGTEKADNLTGTAKADELVGLGGKDVLVGLAGNDTLDGGAGDDDLRGGLGNDIYIVDNQGDINKALADPGIDIVGSLISYILGAQQEHLTLLGKAALSGTGNSLANQITGNDAANILKGLGGDDVLDGKKGIDDLRGGSGDDTYIVDNPGDINKTLIDTGTDIVGAFVKYTLGAQQENLKLLGTTALSGTGNNLANQITGNSGANILKGLGGNDILDGDKGIDDLRGGTGDDLYVIDNAREINKTLSDLGRDEVHSTVSYELGAFQENLVLIGKAAISGTGSSLNNILVGNDAANTLRGMDGVDDLRGGKGNDRLFGGAGTDQLTGGDGADTLNGDAGNDVLFGDAGADVLNGGADNDFLNGGAGIDILRGGSGDDRYVLDGTLVKGVANDTSAEIGTDSDPGTDTVEVNFDYTLGANQENITFYGSAHRGVGNDGNNRLDGSDSLNLNGVELLGLDGNDRLIGGIFADHLAGGDGDDTYVINNANDIDAVDVDEGKDTVESSITYTLLANQEDLTLVSSTSSLNGTGNAKDNLIIGNSGANQLHGLVGNDQLIGGGGADSLFGEAGDDILHFRDGATVIDGGADTDSLFLVGVGVASVALDLTILDDAVIKDIEIVRFASDTEAISQSHDLKLNASDVLALSSTTNILTVLGQSDDSVHLDGSGWVKGAQVVTGFQDYSNGTAVVRIDTHILEANVFFS